MTEQSGSDQGSGNPAAAGGEGGGDAPWYSKIQDADLRGYVEMKGWKDESSVIGSYRQLEQHMGVPPERLLKLPEKADDPSWKAIHQKLGFAAPDSVEGYNLDVPEGAGPEFATKAKEWALKNGIPARMMEGLSKDWNQFMVDAAKADLDAIKAQEAADLQDLRSKWGGQFDTSVELARRAAREMAPSVGLDEAGMNKLEAAIGTATFLKLWAGIGSKTHAEANVHGSSGPGSFAMSPEAAQARINELKRDEGFFKRFQAGDVQAIGEWQRLNRIAAGG